MLNKTLTTLILFSSIIWAADWSKTRVEGFYGQGYAVSPSKANGSLNATEELQVISITHVSSNTYGGNFLFFDVDQRVDKSVAIYGEWAPKFMWGSILGKPLSFSIIKDIGLTGTLEFAPNEINRLIGLNIPVAIPGAVFFDLMPQYRDNPNLPGGTFQLTAAWLFPINIGPIAAAFDGFLDYTLDEGKEGSKFFSKSYFHAQPALFVDLAKFIDPKKAGMFSIGVEYRYWMNKFGIDGLTESIPQIGLRSVF